MINIFKDENINGNNCDNNYNNNISNIEKNSKNSGNHKKINNNNKNHEVQQNYQNIQNIQNRSTTDDFNSGLPIISNEVLNFCDVYFPFNSKIINFNDAFNIELSNIIKKSLVNEMIENSKNTDLQNNENDKLEKNNLVEYFYGDNKNAKYSKFEIKERDNSREKLDYLVEKESEEIRKNYLLVRCHCCWKGVYSKINIHNSVFEDLNKNNYHTTFNDGVNDEIKNVQNGNRAIANVFYVENSDKKDNDRLIRNDNINENKNNIVNQINKNNNNSYIEKDDDSNNNEIEKIRNNDNLEKKNFVTDHFHPYYEKEKKEKEKVKKQRESNKNVNTKNDDYYTNDEESDKINNDKMYVIYDENQNGKTEIGDNSFNGKLDGDYPHSEQNTDITNFRANPLIVSNDDIHGNISESENENEIEFQFIETFGKYGEKSKIVIESENDNYRLNNFVNSDFSNEPETRNTEYESTDFTDNDYCGNSVNNDNQNFTSSKSGNKEEYEKLFTKYNYPNNLIGLDAKKEKEITIDNLLNESRYAAIEIYYLVFFLAI